MPENSEDQPEDDENPKDEGENNEGQYEYGEDQYSGIYPLQEEVFPLLFSCGRLCSTRRRKENSLWKVSIETLLTLFSLRMFPNDCSTTTRTLVWTPSSVYWVEVLKEEDSVIRLKEVDYIMKELEKYEMTSDSDNKQNYRTIINNVLQLFQVPLSPFCWFVEKCRAYLPVLFPEGLHLLLHSWASVQDL